MNVKFSNDLNGSKLRLCRWSILISTESINLKEQQQQTTATTWMNEGK